MKFKIFSFLLFALISFKSYSQSDFTSPPTTEVEYNYITKGYKIQLESGLDTKKGYYFNALRGQKIGNYNFKLSTLIRAEQKEIAAILVQVSSITSGKTYFLCIPHGNNELNTRYFSELSNWDSGITNAYAFFMSTQLGEILPVALAMEKSLKK